MGPSINQLNFNINIMYSSNYTQKQYLSILVEVRDQLNCSISKENDHYISHTYFTISKKIMRLVKVMPIFANNLGFKSLLVQCLQILAVIVQASQFCKYGHLYPRFKYVLKLYQNQNKDIFYNINSTKLYKVIQKNEKFNCKKKLTQIQDSQIKYLQSKQLTNFFKDSTTNQIILSNPNCVSCSQVFIKDLKIQNKNPIFPVCIDFSKQKSMNKTQLLKNICAICNSGGGVIIIGAQRKNEFLYANGIKFETQEQIMELEQQIKILCLQIKPSCFCRVQRIRLHANFMNPNKINVQEQKMRICIRIIIRARQDCRLSYIQFKNKGFHPSYEIYEYKDELKLIKINHFIQHNQKGYSIGIYQAFHKKYFQKHRKNIHKGIECFIPSNNYSKFYKIYCIENILDDSQTQQKNQLLLISQILVQKNYKDQLKFKYKYTSIIVVGASKSKRLAQMMTQYLTETKQPFELQKCFPNCFQGAARTVWMLSHTQNFQDIKNKLTEFTKLISEKPGAVLIMRVYKCLHIDRTKLSQHHHNYIQKKFHLRHYQQIPIKTVQIIDSKNIEKEMVEFTFKNYNEAIFAYMIFEQLQLRPYFMMGSQAKWKANH